jgi:SEC-C motif-containing protein
MRSRYSAFSLGLVDYLIDTLSSDHPERADPDAFRAQSRAMAGHRFLGLTILEATDDGDRGVVCFRARIFARGVDRSFTERSRFRREGGAWRYEGGNIVEP